MSETTPNKKKKSRRPTGLIQWLDDSDVMRSRGEELLHQIKKKPSSGKMWDQQVYQFTTKLAELEKLNEELEAEKLQAGPSFLGTVPDPAWLSDPRPQPHCKYEELEAEKLQAGASFLGTVPDPAWLSDPRPQPHWSIEEARLAGGGSGGTAGGGEAPAPPGLARPRKAKAPKITDALKSMIISMHPLLKCEDSMRCLGAAAAEAGVRLRADAEAPRSLVSFHRVRDVTSLQATDQSVHLSSATVPFRRYLAVLSCSMAGELVAKRALCRHAAALLRARPGRLTVLIHDSLNFLKKGALRDELEQAKVELQLSLGVDTLVLRSAEALAAHVLHAARALADEPHKLGRRAVDEEAHFYMRGDNRNAVAVDDRGNGLAQLWQQMLSVLPNSSLEVGRALAAHCPTLRHMAQTAQSAEGAAAAALSEVRVLRSAAPGARPRRLGPEMGSRLSNLFTQDGDFVLE